MLRTIEDFYSLQSKLNQLFERYSERWQLTISYDKFNIMYVGNTDCKLSMSLNSNALPVVDEVKDLGMFVYSHLTFHSHIGNIVARAFTRSNLILKCFVSPDVNTLMKIFTVYAHRILEYASCVWSPYQMRQIKQVESVQRRFTKRLLFRTCIDYKTRLLRLGVDGLELRRPCHDLIYTYKIVFGLVTNAGSEFFALANSVNATNNPRGHIYKLLPRHSRIDARKYFSLSELYACGTVYQSNVNTLAA